MGDLATCCVYVAMGTTLALLAGRGLGRHRLLLAPLVLAPVIVPAVIDSVPRNVAQSAIYVVLLGVELVFPAASYSFTSDEHLRSAALVAFKRVAFIALKVWIFSAIAMWARPPWSMSLNGVPLWLQALTALLVLDLYQYACHRAQHRFDAWWRLHKLHHATQELSVLATSRSHVLDTMLRQVFGPGLLVYALGLSADAVLWSLFPFVLIDALAHANVNFPQKRWHWLSYVLVLPNVHALHHTPDNNRVNYGMVLTIWDRLLGTFQMPAARPLRFGINDASYTRLGLLAQHLDSLGVLGRRQRPARSLADEMLLEVDDVAAE